MRHSIVVPVYNEEKNISKCLDSIIAQTDKDWECLVIDDGSTDGSGKICDAYAKKDKRFHVEHTKNHGLGAARNLGIEKSSGEWISFLDSDDWIEKNKLQRCYEAAQKSGSSIIWHSMNIIEGSKKKMWYADIEGTFQWDDKRLFEDSRYDSGHSTDKLYERKLLIEHNLRFPTSKRFEDAPFSFKALFYAGSMYKIKDGLYNYKRESGRLSTAPLTPEQKIEIIHSFEDVINEFKNTDKHDSVRSNIDSFLSLLFSRKGRETIDYVFPYVNGSDGEWIELYNKFVTKDKRKDVNSVERYRGDEDMLRYKFRAISENIPWIGVIHLIVSSKSQVPKWIDQSKVHIVLHDDIIPKQFLPTFNSSTIMLFTQNILGLSEKYLVSNDDMFPNDKLQAKHFFNGDKLVFKTFTTKGSRIGPNEEMYKFAFYNAYKLALEKYAKKTLNTNTFYRIQHFDCPLSRSLSKKVYEENKKDLEASITKFRDRKNINEYFFHWAAKYKNMALEGKLSGYVNNIKEKRIEMYRNIINNRKYQYICMNDAESTSDGTYSKLVAILRRRYPRRSKYETVAADRKVTVKKRKRVSPDVKKKLHMPKEVRHFYEL